MTKLSTSSKPLLSLLSDVLMAWPTNASFLVQDADGTVWPSVGDKATQDGGYWVTTALRGQQFDLPELAADHETAIVKRADWLEVATKTRR